MEKMVLMHFHSTGGGVAISTRWGGVKGQEENMSRG